MRFDCGTVVTDMEQFSDVFSGVEGQHPFRGGDVRWFAPDGSEMVVPVSEFGFVNIPLTVDLLNKLLVSYGYTFGGRVETV